MLPWVTKKQPSNGLIVRSTSTRTHVYCSPSIQRSKIFAPIPDSKKPHEKLAFLTRQFVRRVARAPTNPELLHLDAPSEGGVHSCP
jgi:hypothetical protein